MGKVCYDPKQLQVFLNDISRKNAWCQVHQASLLREPHPFQEEVCEAWRNLPQLSGCIFVERSSH